MAETGSGGWPGGLYKPLTPGQVERVHEASLDILERIGFTYETGLDETLEMLVKSGAVLDRDRARVFLPRDLVRERISHAPEKIVLYSRDGRADLELAKDKVYMGTGGLAVAVLDLETGEARPSLLKDLYDIGRLVQRLNHIHFFMRTSTAFDVPPEIHDVNCMYASLLATTKHYMAGCSSMEALQDLFDMCSIAAGGWERYVQRPFYSVTSCFAISPLKLCTLSTQILKEACRQGVPVVLSSAPMAGSTAPLTLAGTLALVHAEEMMGLTIGQTVRPGAPQIYGGIPGAANLQSMDYEGGAIECGMMNAAIHQLSAHIRVPNYNSSGITDSKIPDGQACWEKAFTTLLAAMAGSNYIHHAAGMLESMRTVAFEQYVIDDEIMGMTARVLKGIKVDDEHLGLDAIEAVGPGGNFLVSPHTTRHLRTEFFQGNGVTDRKNRARWEERGASDARDRARQIVRKILGEKPQPCLSEEADRRIRDRFDIRFPVSTG
jgi:trimethylamine--corrinoid protein Co-methyltransferase